MYMFILRFEKYRAADNSSRITTEVMANRLWVFAFRIGKRIYHLGDAMTTDFNLAYWKTARNRIDEILLQLSRRYGFVFEGFSFAYDAATRIIL